MGKLTRTQILSQGINLAGKNSSSTAFVSLVALSWNAWLRSTYKGWLWPYLVEQASGISLVLGTSSLTVGGGQGGITDDVAEVFDPIYLYSSDFAYLGRARVRQIRGGIAEREPAIINPTNNKGMPIEFKARPSPTVEGRLILTPYPFPERNYLLALDYKMQPADTTVDGDIPRYENDRTLIQAAKVCTLEHMKDVTYLSELDILATMVSQDFSKDASRTGINDNLGLDPNTFK